MEKLNFKIKYIFYIFIFFTPLISWGSTINTTINPASGNILVNASATTNPPVGKIEIDWNVNITSTAISKLYCYYNIDNNTSNTVFYNQALSAGQGSVSGSFEHNFDLNTQTGSHYINMNCNGLNSTNQIIGTYPKVIQIYVQPSPSGSFSNTNQNNSCIIPLNQSSCNIVVGWNSNFRSLVKNGNTQLADSQGLDTTVINGVGFSKSINFEHGNTSLSLITPLDSQPFSYSGSQISLDYDNFSASCSNNSSWDGTKCVISTVNPTISLIASYQNDQTNSVLAIDYEDDFSLQWSSSSNSLNSCSIKKKAYNDINFVNLSTNLNSFGNYSVLYLDKYTKYKVACLDLFGSIIESNMVDVKVFPGFEYFITNNVDTISGNNEVLLGQSAQLKWSVLNSLSCNLYKQNPSYTLVDSFESDQNLVNYKEGYLTNPINELTVYRLQCEALGGADSERLLTVWVDNDIGVNLEYSNLGGISPNNNVTLTWTTTNNPTHCVASGGWSGSKNPNGGSTVVSLSQTSNFTLTCYKGTASNSDYITVEIPPAPDLNVSVSHQGQSSSLENQSYLYNSNLGVSWIATGENIDYCGVTPPPQEDPEDGASGLFYINNFNQSVVYTISCSGLGGVVSKNINLNLLTPSGDIVYQPCVINIGDSSCEQEFNYYLNNNYTNDNHIKIDGIIQDGSFDTSATYLMDIDFNGIEVVLFDGVFSNIITKLIKPICQIGSSWDGDACIIIDNPIDPDDDTGEPGGGPNEPGGGVGNGGSNNPGGQSIFDLIWQEF